tara:strand:- start:207 stop:383 length:177 start_codon:yes stop_codon:yes gene_type:complete
MKTAPTLFQPTEIQLLTRGLNTMTKACEAQERLIKIMEADIAELQAKLNLLDHYSPDQ